MAGTLFGLGLSQQFDVNGDPLSGGKLYIYLANTLTAAPVYKNFGLSAGQEHQHPMLLDSTGRVPAFWLADGSYRARLTDEDGVEIFNEPSITAMGPSTGSTPVSVPTEALLSTGDIKWRAGNEVLSGWVKLNGTTIGSATSGATFASGAALPLFEYLWNNFSDALCPVSGTRGGSAASDFSTGTGKTITLLDMRGRSPNGVDDMGSTNIGRLAGVAFNAGGSAIIGGSSGGGVSHVLSQANLPNINLPSTSLGISDTRLWRTKGGNTEIGAATVQATHATTFTDQSLEVDVVSGSISVTGNVPLGGSGTAIPVMNPFMLGTWYIKL